MSEQPQEQIEEQPQQRRLAGRVAVVGFPNAGKSTLINRLTASRQAVVHETPGVTRDRTESVCEWRGREFVLIDTGGVDVGDESPMQAQVAEQARMAVQEAHLVLLVVDARAGLAAGDEEIAQILRRSGRPVVVVANKVDDQAHEQAALDLPNVGKSSLGNAILGRPRVIVADAPGTTRDSIDTELLRGETRFRLIDT